MRRVLAILLSVVFFAPLLSARSSRDWKNVEKLKSGASVLILLWNGERLNGRVDRASRTELHLTTLDSQSTIDRSRVRKIIRIRGAELPDPGHWMIRGALVGGATFGAWGGIHDAVHHSNEAHWFTGALGGAGLGFFGSCVALTGVGVVAMFRHNTVVYEDKTHWNPRDTAGQTERPEVLRLK